MKTLRTVRMVITFLAVTASSPDSSAFDDASPRTPAGDPCDVGTQVETLVCDRAAVTRSRAQVNAAFEKIVRDAKAFDDQASDDVKRMGLKQPTLEARLRAAQSAWIKYADSQCSLEGWTSFGGSGTDILNAECHYRLNMQRQFEIEATDELIIR